MGSNLAGSGVSIFLLIRSPEDSEGFGDFKANIQENIKLGLDLQGGIFMQLEVDWDGAVRQYLEEQSGIIKANLETNDIKVASTDFDFDRLTVTLNNVTAKDDEDPVKEVKDLYRGMWDVRGKAEKITLKLREQGYNQVRNNAVDQTVYKIQGRVDELGVVEPLINRMVGSNRIVVEMPGADNVARVHRIVKEPGKLEWRMKTKNTASAFPTEEAAVAALGANPTGARVFPTTADPITGTVSYMALDPVILTAANVADVKPSMDDRGLPAVGITLDREGGIIFGEQSQNNIMNQMAIVLDGKIISAPVIQTRLSDRFIIQGSFTQQEVQDLVVKINSGSLPADVEILEERVIGPTLGRDAIKSGTTAAAAGLFLVVIFILLYYRRAGVYAFFALIMNLVIIMGMLAGIGAVLTLPGIAGFILTIGMAVDANVLVFERIREELREGSPPKKAVEIGYKSAFVTIMDANITTMIAAFFLWMMGEGPIKGFAVMLMIGIVSSIFTAVFCSRTFFLGYLRGKETLSKLSIWPVWQASH